MLLLCLSVFLALLNPVITVDLDQAAELAADYDSPFIVYFIDDFSYNFDAYSSYMELNSIEVPTSLFNYYLEIASETDYSFTSNLATQFPFEEFQTFITEFPWYSSLLSEADMTTIIAPVDVTSDLLYSSLSQWIASAQEPISYGDYPTDFEYISGTEYYDPDYSTYFDPYFSSYFDITTPSAISSMISSLTSSLPSSTATSSSSSSSSASSSSASSSSSTAGGNKMTISILVSPLAFFFLLL